MVQKQDFNKKLDCTAQYRSLPEEQKKSVRERFIQDSGISHPGFYAKLRRNCWSLLEVQLFENIMRELVWS